MLDETGIPLTHRRRGGADVLQEEPHAGPAGRNATDPHEDLDRRREEFALMAAHELRTPLTVLLGSLATLEHLNASPRHERDRARLIAAAARHARRLRRLTEDLEVAAQSAPLSIALEPTSVREAVREAVEELGLPDRQVRIEIDPHLRAHADRDRLIQTIANLLRNAMAAQGPSGPPVRVRATPAEGWVEISVVDRGPGLDPSRLPRIFDRFADRGPEATGGFGIGLWVVRELVTAMGGRVSLANNPEAGATASIALRRAVEPPRRLRAS